MNQLPSDDLVLLRQLVQEKICFGEELIKQAVSYETLEGIQKLQRKIKQELKFLQKVIKIGIMKKEHIQCSNLTHFAAVFETLRGVQQCKSVNKIIPLEDDRKITVDIICDGGLTWIKVIARNPKSLSQICMGDASFGVRSVLDHAKDYLEGAKLNPHLFQVPKIIFVFSNGVGKQVASKIEMLGIKVEGTKIEEADIEIDDDIGSNSFGKGDIPEEFPVEISNIKKVNLDISAMLAYVSSVCNGSAHLYELPEGVLAQQAAWERLRPQKPILETFFKGKELFCCQTAKDNFLNIVHTVGGPNENKRAEEFLNKITVLPDDAPGNFNTQWTPNKVLPLGGKIKQRSLIIFTFGDRIGAVTVTSNDGFVRSAKQQGVNFVVFVHESRALTEQKEQIRALGPKS